MSEESARIYSDALESGASWEEAWDRMGEINQQVDWDLERMLPEVFDDEERSVARENPE